MNIENFDWGWMGNEDTNSVKHKGWITSEIFVQRLYEKFFQVKEGDVVMDIGASIGPFTYSILDRNPKQVYCIEPSFFEHETLEKNVLQENVKILKYAISDNNGKFLTKELFGQNGQTHEVESKTFQTIIDENNIEKIDFLKTDCEGGEYSIFKPENICTIKNMLGVCVGEWHLSTPELKKKFREFRDTFLRVFKNHKVFSVDGVNIKWDLWNEHFIEYYNEVIIYIDNR